MKRSIALLALAAILPLVVTRGVVETRAAGGWRGEMEVHAADHATAVATLVDHRLTADLDGAEMIAQSPAFDAAIDPQRLAIGFDRLLKPQPRWRAISLSDRAGIRVFDAPHPLAGRPAGPAVDLASQQYAVRTGKPVIGKVVFGPRARPGVAVRAPVVRDGRVTLVVSIVVDPLALRDLLLANGLPRGWHVRLFDAQGTLAVSSDPSDRIGPGARLTPTQAAGAKMPGGAHVERNDRGGAELAIWRKVPRSGWLVEVAIPRAVYDAPVYRAAFRVGATILIGLALLALFLYLLRRNAREERRRNATVMEAQRLEMLGRMTSSVAHDFNNLLTPIVGGFDLLRRRLDGDPRSQALIEAGMKSADRAKALVGHLLAYSRRQVLQPRIVDVSRAIEGLRAILDRTTGSAIALAFEMPAKGPWAEVDPVQLELAVLNLAINARDAMPAGGTLTIRVAERTSALSNDLRPGRYVRIRVTDSGIGMSEATLKMATEPFFTTKPVGAGTGLGLSMIHGFAHQSGGSLQLTSTLGRGTVAELWLPARDEPDEPAAMPEAAPARASGRLLLVDDEDGVRLAQAEMLRDVGYEVTDVGTPPQALALLRSDEAFDLLITDFTMPAMSGSEFALAARALRPDLPILMLTGFAGAVGELPAGTAVLMKPIGQAELLARVAELRQARPARPQHDPLPPRATPL